MICHEAGVVLSLLFKKGRLHVLKDEL